jgi:Fe-S cluster assembly scaffold protein SufB/intein/homing endonuclease
VAEISYLKKEPKWMTKLRLEAYDNFVKKEMPSWGADLSAINFDDIYYYIKPTEKPASSWQDLPEEIKETYDKIGVPQAERDFLAGVSAQYESEVVYKSIKKELSRQGVIFLDMDSGLREYPEIVKEYFEKIVPSSDNKFAALNTAVWSGGSFLYVPKGVKVSLPLQAYFRINAEAFGQFERTLIIAEEGSYVHYIEGCTAPLYTTSSLHAAVVEIFVKKGARVRYTTVQNWSNNVYNLVTKRAKVEEQGVMEWVDCNIGCLPDNTIVWTKRGPTRLKELKVNDFIFSCDINNGKSDFNKINAKQYMGEKIVYLLKTEDDREIEATDNHPFLVLEKNKFYRIYWKQLKDLKKGDFVAIQSNAIFYKNKKIIDFDQKLEKGVKKKPKIPKELDKDWLWFFGVYLGDGYIEYVNKKFPRRLYLAVPLSDKIYKKLIKFIEDKIKINWHQKGITITINSSAFCKFVESLGFGRYAKFKKIPLWIYTLSLEERLAFIRGIIESDGYLRKNKKGEITQIIIVSSNKKLLKDLKLLAISCGLKPLKISSYIRLRKIYKNKKKIYRSYYLYFNFNQNAVIFNEIFMDNLYKKDGLEFIKINSIKKIGLKKVYDLEIDKTSNFYANGILVHNSKVTMKYPSCVLSGEGARGEVLSIAYASKNQHQDAGAKMIHLAPNTSSRIISKSIAKGGGRTSYRGLVYVSPMAKGSKVYVSCDALLMDEISRSDTYPTMKIKNKDVEVQHEATVEKIGEEKLFYLQSRGIKKGEAEGLLVNGFIEPVTKEIPLEYTVELNRLINLEMSGSVG